jgi:hypothetical protein
MVAERWSSARRRWISDWPAGVVGPTVGIRFAIGEMTKRPVANDAAKEATHDVCDGETTDRIEKGGAASSMRAPVAR